MVLTIPSRMRQPGTVSGTATAPAGATLAVFDVPLAPADLVDPTVTFGFSIEQSIDGGVNFVFMAGATFAGEVGLADTPKFGVNCSPFPAGIVLRAAFTITGRAVSIGGTLTVT